jgi:hypothetical protein
MSEAQGKERGHAPFPTSSYSHLSALVTLKGFHRILGMKFESLEVGKAGMPPSLFRKNL